MNILLLEPDRILASIYKEALTRAGHKVAHVTTAQAGITAADQGTPDVVILEMQLVRHSGAAFLYEFRTYSDWLHIPVIIHTLIPPGNLKSFARSFKELGVSDCLYKSKTTLSRLVETVNQYAHIKS
jgi:CheY-like chemotaxis protein